MHLARIKFLLPYYYLLLIISALGHVIVPGGVVMIS